MVQFPCVLHELPSALNCKVHIEIKEIFSVANVITNFWWSKLGVEILITSFW